MSCKHGKLTQIEPEFTGASCSFENTVDFKDAMPEYFMYKRYKCEDCGGTVVVLHAVVEKPKETKNGL